MGLDTNFYYVTEKKVHNPKTKEVHFTTTPNNECAYFRKNYCLMEWFDKHWGISVDNCEYYLVDKEDIDALLKDCQLAIDLVDDAMREMNISINDDFTTIFEKIDENVQNQLVKLFPMNGWRHGKKRFDVEDYSNVKEIVRKLEDIYWEDTDKLIFTNWW